MMQRSNRPAELPSDEVTWARWGVVAGVAGMLSWIVGVAMIPPDARLQYGAAQLARVLQEHALQNYVAALTITGVLGLERAHLSPRWVGMLGWISAAAHVVILFTVDQQGAFAPDGLVGTLAPVTTVLWILALSASLPAQVRRRPGLGKTAAIASA